MIADNSEKYKQLREAYPCFEYKGFEYGIVDGDFEMVFHFFCGEHSFNPKHIFKSKDFYSFTDLNKEQLDLLVFNVGMIELVSYWKAFCSKKIRICNYSLDSQQQDFWRKIYFHGLGEFFFVNGIQTDINSFVEFEYEKTEILKPCRFDLEDRYIVPIGGGKDSVVSLDLLYGAGRDVRTFIINPRGATLDCCSNANISRDEILEDRRTIDAHLLELNAQGFLNGHTPFSAMLAFTSLLVAAFSKRKHIALSNESSANESTVKGEKINHQYSKSLEFENDFRSYVSKYISPDFNYFSFLRPLTELHIAKLFSQLKYQYVFKSCNAGSKQDIWCGNCPKCLFAFIILSPFLEKEVLKQVFGKNLFEDENLKTYLLQLCGVGEQKPFECVGTIEEVNIAIAMRIRRNPASEREVLLHEWLNQPFAKQYLAQTDTDFCFTPQKDHNLLPRDYEIFSKTYSVIKKAELRRMLSMEKIAILGFGREGKSSLNLLKDIMPKQNLIVADGNKEIISQNQDSENSFQDIEFRFLEAGNFDEVTLFLKTPGIPCSAIGFVQKEKLTSQSDLFLRLFANQVVAISGTKGKSTTSSLLYKIIKDQNPNVVFAGNIGLPLFEVLDEINEETIIVVEMSAHQLQFIEKSPHISVLLNLYEEHLDHFENCSEYWNAKFNLALHKSKGDFFVYNSEDERIESLLRENELKSECIAFSKEEYDYAEPMYLKGEHNKLNALAALKVAEILGLNKEKAVESLMGFEPLQHRLQMVATINDVTYYNDSISTIPEATIAALDALKEVQTLILGGKDRGIDYSVLIKGLSKYSVENIAFVGQAGKRMNQMLKDAGFKYNCLESNNYEDIVKWCADNTQKGKICLLSPAASSYDMFRNFEHRGEVFSTLVKALRNI